MLLIRMKKQSSSFCLYAFFTFFLSGCSSVEDKLVDIAGIVFLLYSMLLAWKLLSPLIVIHPKFRTWWEEVLKPLLQQTKYTVMPVYIIGTFFLILGVLSENIFRISLPIAILCFIFAYNVSRFLISHDEKQRILHIEILGQTAFFIFILFSIMLMGDEMLDQL